ncbi:MAG: AMMECR1 domain-containing protein [Anaerolineae bacterium]|jgi:AMMECR1 domain-containing protein
MFHPLIDLARAAIRHYLATGEYLDVSDLPGDGPARGLFVSLHDPPRPGEVEGDLRGCRGNVWPDAPTLYAEVVREAVNSAVDDPRCPSVEPDEVDDVVIAVYLLKPYEEVQGLDDLDPARYGVMVEGESGRRALLLPGIPGIKTAEEQVYLTRRKASIHPDEPATIYRFEADVLQ